MWANTVKPKTSFKKWHRKALVINLEKTRVVFMGADADSEHVPSLISTGSVQSEQLSLWTNESHFGINYCVESLEEPRKDRLGFHWLEQAVFRVSALLGRAFSIIRNNLQTAESPL